MNANSPLIQFLLSTILPLIIKTCAYLGVLKWRKHNARLLTCIILGGAIMIPAGLIGLPPLLTFVAGIGIAVVILSRYTETPIVFEGLYIILGIEIGFAFLERLVIAPLIY